MVDPELCGWRPTKCFTDYDRHAVHLFCRRRINSARSNREGLLEGNALRIRIIQLLRFRFFALLFRPAFVSLFSSVPVASRSTAGGTALLAVMRSRATFSPRLCNSRIAVNMLSHASCAAFADRKSTRLNSSHLVISYAVFCL